MSRQYPMFLAIRNLTQIGIPAILYSIPGVCHVELPPKILVLLHNTLIRCNRGRHAFPDGVGISMLSSETVSPGLTRQHANGPNGPKACRPPRDGRLWRAGPKDFWEPRLWNSHENVD